MSGIRVRPLKLNSSKTLKSEADAKHEFIKQGANITSLSHFELESNVFAGTLEMDSDTLAGICKAREGYWVVIVEEPRWFEHRRTCRDR